MGVLIGTAGIGAIIPEMRESEGEIGIRESPHRNRKRGINLIRDRAHLGHNMLCLYKYGAKRDQSAHFWRARRAGVVEKFEVQGDWGGAW
jgi:hypothetical protein